MSQTLRDPMMADQVKRILYLRFPLIALLSFNCMMVAVVPFAQSRNRQVGQNKGPEQRPSTAPVEQPGVPSGPAQTEQPAVKPGQPNAAPLDGKHDAPPTDRPAAPSGKADPAEPARSPRGGPPMAPTPEAPAEQNGAASGAAAPTAQHGTADADQPIAATKQPPGRSIAPLWTGWRAGKSIGHLLGQWSGMVTEWPDRASVALARTAGKLAKRSRPPRVIVQADEPPHLVLVNPKQTGGQVHYLVDGQVHTLQPGQQHDLAPGRAHLVRFHRGGQFGNARYSLSSGCYQFHVTSRGWDLSPAAGGTSPQQDSANANQ